MARKKMEPAELAYTFTIPANAGTPATKYIDIAQVASAVNRRLYQQGKCYYVSRISLTAVGASTVAISTLPDTWVTANAWTKAKALWNQMNKGVLKDNPSVQGKWADFKVFMDKAHYEDGTVSSSGTTLNLLPLSGNVEVKANEWYYGRYVEPQHDVVQATGVEKPADEYYCHMMGDDSGTAGAYGSVGIIKGYETTRARVQIAPDVPANMQTNWMTALTDLGGQDPELANVLEDANDNPPYDIDEYPGGESNFNLGVGQSFLITTTSLNSDKDLGFKAPLGLLKLTYAGAAATLMIHLTPGHYKGLMATDVKQ